MAKSNRDTDKPLDQFLISIKSRPVEKKVKFTRWKNSQQNAQASFLQLVEYCIERFGYEDITDFEISKQFHEDIFLKNNNISETQRNMIKSVENNNKQNDEPKVLEIEEKTYKVEKIAKNEIKSEDFSTKTIENNDENDLKSSDFF